MLRRPLPSILLAIVIVGGPVALAAPAGAAVSPFTSCADVAAADPGATDGDYTISVYGRTLDVYCADLATAPVEYLPLAVTGASSNYGERVADWANWPGTTIVTHYTRLRLDLPTSAGSPFTVDGTDTRFATSVGDIGGSTTQPWASASACNYPWGSNEFAAADADLTGTPFGISAASFVTDGFAQAGRATQVSPQHVVVEGDGWCGGTAPAAVTAVPLTWLGAVAPYVTDAPDDVTVASGGDAVFTSVAAGDAPVTAQWQTSSDGTTWTDVAGATGGTLTLAAVTTADDGLRVRVQYTNAEGTVPSAPATLTVTAVGPVVTAAPTDATVTAGDDAVFTVAATGDPAPSVRWEVSTDAGATWDVVDGETDTSLTIADVTTAANGLLVRAVVTNTAAAVKSSAARLTVAPLLATPTTPADVTADVGGRAVFTVTADGDPAPTLQWQGSTDGGATWIDIVGASQTTLTLENLRAQDDGLMVRVVATNAAGSAVSDAARLRVVAATAASASVADGPGGATSATGVSAGLARTGAEPAGAATLAVALVLAGAGALALVRRLRPRSTS